MRSRIVGFAVIALIVLAFVYNLPKSQEISVPKTLKIGGTVLNIEVADTDTKREKGLSGKDLLEEDQGMLFVFDKDGYYGIWMKDMRFPIDVAWLDRNGKIVHLEKNIMPDTYPKVFSSLVPSMYFLEVNSGFFDNSKIKIGDIVEF